MSVPNTNTFTLQDVCDELNNNGESGIGDLAACFANANAPGFDPVYEGSKDRLSNFRNYTHVSSVQYVDKFSGSNFPGTIVSSTIPVAVETGDLIVLLVYAEAYVDIVTPPSGYTQEEAFTASNQPRVWAYTKVAGVSDSGSGVSIEFSDTNKNKRIVGFVVRGQSASFKGDGWGSVYAQNSATSWDPILSVSAGSFVVSFTVLSGNSVITNNVTVAPSYSIFDSSGSSGSLSARGYVAPSSGSDAFDPITFSNNFVKGFAFEILVD